MLYIGIMSGTSLDGIDVAAVDISSSGVNLVAQHYAPYSDGCRQQVSNISFQADATLDSIAMLDQQLGQRYALAVNELLSAHNLDKNAIQAIGCHGQTIRHHPNPNGFSWQLGDANQIVELTGITTVADFRRRDIAAGGEGAPLAPVFHLQVFGSPHANRQILNLGGIANITLLKQQDSAVGFDIGPANCLMNEWANKHWQKEYDKDGLIAQSGKVHSGLLSALLEHDYFKQAPPKSTGRELFNMAYLEQRLNSFGDIAAQDVMATLLEMTAQSIVSAIELWGDQQADVFACGGGAHNSYLLQRLQALLPELKISTTETLGIHPDWVEAAAFAWLAYRTMNNLAGNLPEVTGAEGERILGAIYPR